MVFGEGYGKRWGCYFVLQLYMYFYEVEWVCGEVGNYGCQFIFGEFFLLIGYSGCLDFNIVFQNFFYFVLCNVLKCWVLVYVEFLLLIIIIMQ